MVSNKGILGDRHYKEFNDPYCQLSLIESENIDYYNAKYGLDIPYVNFRRNIVTKGIRLNELVGKNFLLGKQKLKALCRPCRHLTEVLNQNNILRSF